MSHTRKPAKTVLVLIVDGFEEIETVTPVDLLRRAGDEVLLVSVTGATMHRGRCGMSLVTDTTLEEVADMPCDLLILPGGPGVSALRADPAVGRFLMKQHAAGALIGAICAAPAVRADAGLLKGRRFTAHFSMHEALPQADGAGPVVIDDRLITARGAGASMAFGLALVEALHDAATRTEIARQIML